MAQTEIIQADKPQSGEVTTGGNAALSLLQNSLANPDYPAERIDKALEWVERLEKKAAIEQFNASFAEMQSEMPVVPKNGKGHQNARYATLEDIVKTTKTHLAKFGFGLNWSCSVDQKEKLVTITASLRHREGHSIENTGVYPFETSGSKNAIQSIGSAQTYGQRYTASALLGLAMGDADDDGKAASASEVITERQAENIRNRLEATNTDTVKFCEFFKIDAVPDLPKSKYGDAEAIFDAKETA